MDIRDDRIDEGKAFDWGKTSEAYAKYRDIYPEEFYRKVADRGLCVKGQRVLDLGTGTGVLPRNMYKFGAEWVGTDISPEQIEQAKLRISAKTDCKKFIAYFQPFTNTYADTEYLKKIYYEAIVSEEVVALSIATRPDCLNTEVLQLLEEINQIKPVWVELGLQTIHKKTSDYIRRCYELEVYDKAVDDLKSIGVSIITHIILGLPNESKEMMLQSVKYAGERSDGVKLQLLHVLKDTDLRIDFENKVFDTLSLEEYIDILCDCIEILPESVVIHRLTGDGDKKILISPMWSADKKRVLNTINKVFNERNIIQGRKYKSSD